MAKKYGLADNRDDDYMVRNPFYDFSLFIYCITSKVPNSSKITN